MLSCYDKILVVKEKGKRGKKIGLAVRKTGLEEGSLVANPSPKAAPTPVHIWGVCRNSSVVWCLQLVVVLFGALLVTLPNRECWASRFYIRSFVLSTCHG